MGEKLLVVGPGGREHALVWKLAQSPRVEMIYVAPGNGGTGQMRNVKNIPFAATDIKALVGFAKINAIDLTVVGSEDSLVKGIVDAFKDEGLPIFGPTKQAAVIESSKVTAKEMMIGANIPTARARIFWESQRARTYVRSQTPPLVVKASGPASGKGAVLCQTIAEAELAIEDMMVKRILKDAGGMDFGRRISLWSRNFHPCPLRRQDVRITASGARP